MAASLVGDGLRFSWSFRGADDLRLPLWLVSASAVELLTEGDLARVKQCPGADDCGWLFYDTSRNGKRRWCSMEGCGSRVKMRRYYTRVRRAHG
jgi:predicted RNA-binding Zn ribbon-like protein